MSDLVSVAVVLAIALALAALLGGWLLWTAGRLDRQHLRLEAARSSLDAQLARRSSLAAELAATGTLDPASSLVLLDAAVRARDATGVERWQAESDLTDVLVRVGEPPTEVRPQFGEITDAARRAGMARRIHNDLATAAIALHERRRVRWFRLAGRAEPPTLIEFDDRPPELSDPPSARAS